MEYDQKGKTFKIPSARKQIKVEIGLGGERFSHAIKVENDLIRKKDENALLREQKVIF